MVNSNMAIEEIELKGDGSSDIYTLTLDPNGGYIQDWENPQSNRYVTSPYKIMDVRFNETLPSFPQPPKRRGYTFCGWFKTESGYWTPSRSEDTGTTKYPYKDQIELTGDTVWEWKRDATFEARWEPELEQLTWIGNGGVWNDNVSRQIDENVQFGYVIGGLASFTTPPTRRGYSFAGWFTHPIQGTQVDAYDTVQGNATYYAHWKLETYAITYNLNGNGKLPSDAPHSYNITELPITIPQPQETPTHRFIEWEPIGEIPNDEIGDKEFSAIWEQKTYCVQFDSNNGFGQMDNQTGMGCNLRVQLSSNLFTNTVLVRFNANEGTSDLTEILSTKEFLGWAKEPDQEIQYRDQAYVKNLTTVDNVICLYAIWGRNYDGLLLPEASRPGYTFENWHTSIEGGVDVGGAGDWYVPEPQEHDSDKFTVNLYAHWKPIPYTVRFVKENGEEDYVVSNVIYGTRFGDIRPVNPEKASTVEWNYEFLNWKLDGEDIQDDYLIKGDLVVKAVYEQSDRLYKVVFLKQDGITKISEHDVKYMEYVSFPEPPSEPGYEFQHWIIVGPENGRIGDSTQAVVDVVGNVDIKAIYERITRPAPYCTQFKDGRGNEYDSNQNLVPEANATFYNLEYGLEYPGKRIISTPSQTPPIYEEAGNLYGFDYWKQVSDTESPDEIRGEPGTPVEVVDDVEYEAQYKVVGRTA